MRRFDAPGDATLADLIGIGPGDVIAAIGGGGKTTILEALAGELAARRTAVVMTTTTKTWPRSGPTVLRGGENWPPCPGRGEIVTAAARLGADGKLHGLTPETVCALRSNDRVVLCEADGSAGQSLKVHGPGEPVVPECASTVICVAGLDALDRPIDAATVHRLERWESVLGQRESYVSPRSIACVLQAGARHAPSGSRVIFVLNKASGKGEAVAEIARRLDGSGDMVVATERGRPVGPLV